jgi:hypothetical protein
VLEIMSVTFGGPHYYMIYKTNGSLKGECPVGYVFSNIINKGCAGDTVVPISLILTQCNVSSILSKHGDSFRAHISSRSEKLLFVFP